MGGQGSGKKGPLFQIIKTLYPETDEKELYSKILCGEVKVDSGIVKDPKLIVRSESEIVLFKKAYVSRGGEKLEHALDVFEIDVRDRFFLDAGCSTGGFSHCLLSRGAAGIHAVDVGYNQLDFSLRRNSRIFVREKTNIMSIESLKPEPDAAVADLSFRSIKGAAPHILSLVKEKWMIALIKPQFEWENPPESFNGVVSGHENLVSIIRNVVTGLESEGVHVLKAADSPIPGRKGNREFLFLLGYAKGMDADDIISALF